MSTDTLLDEYSRLPSEAPATPRERGFWQRRFRPGLLLSMLFLTLLVLAALAPSLLVSADPLETHPRESFRPPSLAHPLGQDENGRDLLARIVYGARSTLAMGLLATAIGLCAGIAIGLTAGLGPRRVDQAVMRFVDVLLAFPDLLLALVIITFFGSGTLHAILAVGVASIPRYARLVRAQAHQVRDMPYVQAATTLGLGRATVVFRHILPNALRPVVVLALVGIGGKIAIGASLGFLGLGAPPPAPEWGAMLSVSRDFLGNAWWMTAAPAGALVLTVLSTGVLGRELLRRKASLP